MCCKTCVHYGMLNNMEDLNSLQGKLAYTFNNMEWLHQALTHRSYTHENPDSPLKDNEKMEFLGDAVLDLVIRDLLLKALPNYSEGELSKIRAWVVNESTLAKVARSIQLGSYLLLGKGEELSGGRNKSSILADAYEALVAAIYLDGGFMPAFEVIKKHFALILKEAIHTDFLEDYKTQLQEYSQERFKSVPTYEVEREVGPDHDKTFFVTLLINGKIISRGIGKSKKEAEQHAAKDALQLLSTRYKVQDDL